MDRVHQTALKNLSAMEKIKKLGVWIPHEFR